MAAEYSSFHFEDPDMDELSTLGELTYIAFAGAVYAGIKIRDYYNLYQTLPESLRSGLEGTASVLLARGVVDSTQNGMKRALMGTGAFFFAARIINRAIAFPEDDRTDL